MYKINRFVQLFILLVLMLVFSSTSASAALVRCRTDPIFKLSNGDILTVTLDVGTNAHNISNIHYVLHLPPGVTITQVTYTAGAKKEMKETYAVKQINPAKTYTVDTLLTTFNPATVDVTVFVRLNEDARKTVAGHNGQHLIASIIKHR